jgi:hypothetical protein
LRSDNRFVQDKGWDAAYERYEKFITKYSQSNVLYLELGVGGNTPAIIKYPFWRLTEHNKKARYVCINYGEAICPTAITSQSICINEDIGKVIEDIRNLK